MGVGGGNGGWGEKGRGGGKEGRTESLSRTGRPTCCMRCQRPSFLTCAHISRLGVVGVKLLPTRVHEAKQVPVSAWRGFEMDTYIQM